MRKCFFMSIFMLGLFLVSCQEEDTYYSCDPDIDMWVKENLDEVQSIDTETFRTFDVGHRLAIFNAISPEMRVEIWREKLTQTLNLNWNIAEREHIERLLTILEEHIEWYDTGVPDEKIDEYEKIAYRWVDYAREELKWNNDLIAAIAATPMLLSNTKGELINNVKQTNVRRLKSGSENCTCNPVVSFCSPCSYTTCEQQSWGCGLMGLGICNGTGC